MPKKENVLITVGLTLFVGAMALLVWWVSTWDYSGWDSSGGSYGSAGASSSYPVVKNANGYEVVDGIDKDNLCEVYRPGKMFWKSCIRRNYGNEELDRYYETIQ